MLTWELAGAVIGAGLASGREIAAFFSRFGRWGIVGILLSVAVLLFLSDAQPGTLWPGRWPARLWKCLLTLLLMTTGGAMLSGAGEVAALTLPVRSAYRLGMALTCGLAWVLAMRTAAGLAWVSRVLLAVLGALIATGLVLTPMRSVQLEPVTVPQALLCGINYGGFNAALQSPVLAAAQHIPPKCRRGHAAAASGIVLLLLILGHAVLLRHPALIGENLPFLVLMNRLGKWGYLLGSISLYLAILSTLTACIRGLQGRWWAVLGIVAISLLGFQGVVARVYPVLGGGCFLMLAAAKLTNCSSPPFHSRKDML